MKQIVKINLGCGPDGVAGWINFDWGWLPLLSKFWLLLRLLVKLGFLNDRYLRVWPKIYLHDLRKGIPLDDNSVDWIYNSNFMEHLEKSELIVLFKECFRVLKVGGKMRVVVPNLAKIIDNYLTTQNSDKFCREFYGYDKDLNMGWKKWAIRGHQWMYDVKSMVGILKKIGFKKAIVSKFRNSMMPDIEKLDLPIHQFLGLYIEVEKV